MESKWTLDSLFEHFRKQLEDLEKRIQLARANDLEAVAKAETSVNKRLEGMNEFRGALADKERVLMPRAEAQLQYSVLLEKVAKLEEAQLISRSQSAGSYKLWAILAGVLALIMALWRFLEPYFK